MSRRRGPNGGPSADDLHLWDRVISGAERLSPRARAAPEPGPAPQLPARPTRPPEARAPAPPLKTPRPATALPPGFRIGGAAPGGRNHDLGPSLEDRLAARTPRMDRKTHRRLTRGRIEPEARLDLHGMTLERAHAALRGFVAGQAARGARAVLVITGKGREERNPGPIPVPRGILRHELPRWLELPPLSALVIDFAPAHARHGGNGAYYLWLRRTGGQDRTGPA